VRSKADISQLNLPHGNYQTRPSQRSTKTHNWISGAYILLREGRGGRMGGKGKGENLEERVG